MNVLNSSLFNRFILALLVAVIVPVVFIGASATDAALRTNEQAIRAYVAENGALRERNIVGNIERAQLDQADFVSDLINEPIIYSLMVRGQREANAQAMGSLLLERFLTPANVIFDQTWILELNGTVLTSATSATGEVETAPQVTPTQDAYQLGLRLIQQELESNAIAITQVEDGVIIEIVSPLALGGGTVAMLISRVNTDDLIVRALEPTGNEISTYSYLILPPEEGISTEQAIIAPQSVRDANLVTANSLLAEGPQLALSGGDEAVLSYAVTDLQGNQRDVIGHMNTINIQGLDFVVVTELDQSSINQSVILELGTVFSSGVIITGIAILVLAYLLNRGISTPLGQITQAINEMRRGQYDAPLPAMTRQDEIGQIASSLNRTRDTIYQSELDMQQRLQTLTRDLRITQEISQSIAQQRNVQALMDQIVNLIIDRFEQIYHAQVFLVDEQREYAVLRSSTGQAGQNLLARGHRLPVGSISVIGQVTDEGTIVVARDAAMSHIHRRNEFLQDTRAELAIPLQTGDRIIGALDVQSRQSDSFDEDMINALKVLADQLTIAIENANLYTQTQRLLQDTQQNQQAGTYRRWTEYLRRHRQGLLASQTGHTTDFDFSELVQIASQDGRPAVGVPTERGTVPFVVPIKMRDQILGFAEYEVRQDDFQPDMVLLAEELVGRLALGIDNARLFNESQQTAARERIVNEISARITGKTDVEDILQTAVQEVSRVLQTPNVGVRLQRMRTAQNGNGNSQNGNGQHTNGTATDEPTEPPSS